MDGPDYAHLDDDRDIARAGGVGIHDRIEVQPFIEKEGRFSLRVSIGHVTVRSVLVRSLPPLRSCARWRPCRRIDS